MLLNLYSYAVLLLVGMTIANSSPESNRIVSDNKQNLKVNIMEANKAAAKFIQDYISFIAASRNNIDTARRI